MNHPLAKKPLPGEHYFGLIDGCCVADFGASAGSQRYFAPLELTCCNDSIFYKYCAALPLSR
jgi:hypothetical protein